LLLTNIPNIAINSTTTDYPLAATAGAKKRCSHSGKILFFKNKNYS